ncbi:50S ribosomal protein L3 [Frankliniella fusca]|uniref:50S ribosomal protein L3 n=1 Tax=Frankliniella fusca TaxID=407009 RepID=A0AAE1HY19_9NEOP|nr:50S ribosomal protein L3 [Frankliniella fusca]
MYVFRRQKKDGEGWRCDQRGKCNGRITVFMDTVLDEQPDTHEPDWGRCREEETVQSIKKAAETSRATTVAVVQAKVARVSYETAMKRPKFDSLKKMEEERVIILSTNQHLKLVALATYWVMDGTFKVARNVVCQVYAIHGAINGNWVPLVIVLMERKTRRSYEHVFEVLEAETRRRVRRNLEPVKISTDYEQSAIQAVRAAFTNAQKLPSD